MNNLIPSSEVNMELVYRKLIFSETEIPTQLDIPSEESDTVISCDSILESVKLSIDDAVRSHALEELVLLKMCQGWNTYSSLEQEESVSVLRRKA